MSTTVHETATAQPIAPTTVRRPGFYERRIFPRILNWVMDTEETRRIRAEVCAPLAGEVLEIGFGTGHNLPFLPATVRRLLAVDPSLELRALAAERIEAASVPVDFVGFDGQQLPLADRSVDAALSTWTLCSVEDPVSAVREVARVLKPGGTLHFVEHGRSPDARVRRWQHRCNGLQRWWACGCNIDRDLAAAVTEGGLVVEELDTYYTESEPKVLGWTFQGRAVRR